MTDRNSGTIADGRNPDGTIALGNPGKPMGSCHWATTEIECCHPKKGESFPDQMGQES